MKRISRVLGSIMLVAVAATSCTTADSSEVALVVDQIGNDKGVPNVQMESGFIMYFPPTQDVFLYPTNIQHKVWTAGNDEGSPGDEHIDVTSADGATFGLDVALNTQLERSQASKVFIKYRRDINEIMDTRIRNIVRKSLLDEAVTFASDSLLQHRNVYEQQVNKVLAAAMVKEGFINSDLTVLKMTVPQAYRDAINAKINVIQQTAKIRSQTIQAEQEAQRKVAVAKGNFEAAQYDAKTKEIMSQPKMLELYRAETERVWAEAAVSPYGSNNVFGASTGIMLNKS
jgi:regulator of protease activity HflC (stomatin/prohibitin superfamily)